MKIIRICFSFILIASALSEFSVFRPKTIRFNRFDEKCSEYPNTPIYYSDVNIVTRNRTVYLSMKIHITKSLQKGEGLKLHLKLMRCSNRDDLNSCERFNTIKINNFCLFLEGEDKPWSSFVKLIHPPIGPCPFKTGVFRIDNGTFDGSKFSSFPVSDWYWRVTVLMISDKTDNVIMCTLVEGQIAPV